MLYEVSSVFHAAKIWKPLIVLSGRERSAGVTKAESDDVVYGVIVKSWIPT
jgi:hypothetical protein